MLEIRDLRHRFEEAVEVLDVGVLRIPDHELVTIIGPSGCGKSTLLRVLAGLIVPDAGTITRDGVDLPPDPGFAGFMPQHDRLLPWRRALDNAVLAADVKGVDRVASRERARALFDRFGLGGFEESWPRQLSGGMRQRLAVLRTFLTDSDLLLLDEPFGALDAMTRRHMHVWLTEVLAANPRTVVFVTHDVDEALVLSDRIVVLSQRPGRIVTEMSLTGERPRPPDIVTDPAFISRKAELLQALDSGGIRADPPGLAHEDPPR